MKFLYSPVSSSFSYSAVTIFAPTAVSSAAVNPSFPSAIPIGRKSFSPNAETKLGATDATTGFPEARSASTSAISLWTRFAFWGHTTVHLPQRIHLSSMIRASWSTYFIAFTGHSRRHL